MTCIAGAIKGNEVWIGADAAASQDGAVRMAAQAKVFQVGEFLIGTSGSLRGLQIIRYLFVPPAVEGELIAYMVRAFVPALRSSIKENGQGEQGDSA